MASQCDYICSMGHKTYTFKLACKLMIEFKVSFYKPNSNIINLYEFGSNMIIMLLNMKNSCFSIFSSVRGFWFMKQKRGWGKSGKLCDESSFPFI